MQNKRNFEMLQNKLFKKRVAELCCKQIWNAKDSEFKDPIPSICSFSKIVVFFLSFFFRFSRSVICLFFFFLKSFFQLRSFFHWSVPLLVIYFLMKKSKNFWSLFRNIWKLKFLISGFFSIFFPGPQKRSWRQQY